MTWFAILNWMFTEIDMGKNSSICVYMCGYACICECTYARVYVFVCISVRLCVCMCRVCVCFWKCSCLDTCVVWVWVRVCISGLCVYMCVCICLYYLIYWTCSYFHYLWPVTNKSSQQHTSRLIKKNRNCQISTLISNSICDGLRVYMCTWVRV